MSDSSTLVEAAGLKTADKNVVRSSKISASRLLFIDMFRGFVTLIMIEGHVTNSLVLSEIRNRREFHPIHLLHGFPAASFVFIAGFAIALVLDKKWESFLNFEKPLWMQVRRLLFILLIGFWLHLPVTSFWQMLKLDRESFYWFLRCDILHMISLSLLALIASALIFRNKKFLTVLWGFLALAITFATPFVHEVDFRNYLPAIPADYLNFKHRALFPIFPWAAFTFAGAFLCKLYLMVKDTPKERAFFTTLAALGVIFFFGAFALLHVPWSYHTYQDPATQSPRHFMMKMGFIFAVLAAFWSYEQRKKSAHSWMNNAGQESLMVYAVHLVIVYGSPFTPGIHLARLIGPNLTFLESLVVTFLLISTMVVLALLWNKAKKERPREARIFFYGLVAYFFIVFFF